MTSNSMVPGAPFGRVISEWKWMKKNEELGDISVPLQWLATQTGVDKEALRKLKNGKREWVGFDIADKIVTAIDPFLWRNDPELAEIYQSVDLTGLDRRRPCVAA